jgi:hypothetical protein
MFPRKRGDVNVAMIELLLPIGPSFAELPGYRSKEGGTIEVAWIAATTSLAQPVLSVAKVLSAVMSITAHNGSPPPVLPGPHSQAYQPT